MRNGISGVILTAGLVAVLAWQGGCRNTAATKPAPAANPAPKAGMTKPSAMQPADAQQDEFQQAAAAVGAKGDQLKDIETRREAFYAGLKALETSPERQALDKLRPQLDEARKAKDEAKIADISAQMKPHDESYWAKRSALRAGVFAAFTPQQQLQLVRENLRGKVQSAVRKAKPTDQQIARINQMVDSAANKFYTPQTFTADPYLKGIWDLRDQVVAQVKTDVLTEEQRAILAPAPKK